MDKDAKTGEMALYEPIRRWLQSYLQAKHSAADVKTFDVHSVFLSDFLQSEYRKYFPQYEGYRFKIDILGLVTEKATCRMVVVEVKLSSMTLLDFSQTLGYCRVLKPEWAFLISPRGMNSLLHKLLKDHRRKDILEYERNRFVHIAKWDSSKNAIDNSTVIPPL